MPFDDEPTPYESLPEPSPELDRLARLAIGAAIEVHRHLGPGLPEQAYQIAMQIEMRTRGIPFTPQKIVDVFYKGIRVTRMKIDLVIGDRLVVELKSVEALAPIDRLQARTYMRLLGEQLALLINFNVPVLKDGIRRVVETS
jgi:GxxExxY protein